MLQLLQLSLDRRALPLIRSVQLVPCPLAYAEVDVLVEALVERVQVHLGATLRLLMQVPHERAVSPGVTVGAHPPVVELVVPVALVEDLLQPIQRLQRLLAPRLEVALAQQS